ncbi:hypothetical protein [Methylocucumis oryzae]|uniref:DNA-binding protein n=1 Tax=Methylocucumis oryzae TaxID=1632867 RepID=A0A0F3IG65_9GAMM|nr:hypothetical protein [Methylocucumis oryzae]KJV05672.1 hypothetical protein VZ94_16540 [Methylocucumis oryzae]
MEQTPMQDNTMEKQLMQLPISVNVSLPMIHQRQSAELNGLSEGMRGWIDNGYLLVKVGRYTMVNLVQLAERLKNGTL